MRAVESVRGLGLMCQLQGQGWLEERVVQGPGRGEAWWRGCDAVFSMGGLTSGGSWWGGVLVLLLVCSTGHMFMLCTRRGRLPHLKTGGVAIERGARCESVKGVAWQSQGPGGLEEREGGQLWGSCR